ncbi:SemiSWEET transporter [Chelatococcus sp. SYSU_G07232]|uniref:SemiSWEET transporter n=1 Tax=Chelatococcus albus TaxID=3047466 RepID=A0ABT7AIP9_9HYPH|nr:SemiSWEET transporter [Chelatococcus sp. SYSU_G07232]MDJ1159256.1 SemiSWEET transporter [Chelatococcus sp. SYSU_G07232]
MPPAYVEALGSVAAVLTTFCWIPQAVKVIRTRETRAISLTTQVALSVGVVLWLLYGILHVSWPLIGANAVTLVLLIVILAMKLRHG